MLSSQLLDWYLEESTHSSTYFIGCYVLDNLVKVVQMFRQFHSRYSRAKLDRDMTKKCSSHKTTHVMLVAAICKFSVPGEHIRLCSTLHQLKKTMVAGKHRSPCPARVTIRNKPALCRRSAPESICLLDGISFSKKIKKQLTVRTEGSGEIIGEVAWNNVAVSAGVAVSGICGTC